MATSLMLLDFCDLLVIGLTGFLCILMRLKKVLAQLISTQKTMPNLARVRKNTFRCKPVPLKKIKHVSSRTTHGPGGPRVQEGYANDRNVGWKSETTVRLPHELEVVSVLNLHASLNILVNSVPQFLFGEKRSRYIIKTNEQSFQNSFIKR